MPLHTPVSAACTPVPLRQGKLIMGIRTTIPAQRECYHDDQVCMSMVMLILT
jgi:hypothetical protein